jgi:hypothetical protein
MGHPERKPVPETGKGLRAETRGQEAERGGRGGSGADEVGRQEEQRRNDEAGDEAGGIFV